jgi:hypothetical protein
MANNPRSLLYSLGKSKRLNVWNPCKTHATSPRTPISRYGVSRGPHVSGSRDVSRRYACQREWMYLVFNKSLRSVAMLALREHDGSGWITKERRTYTQSEFLRAPPSKELPPFFHWKTISGSSAPRWNKESHRNYCEFGVINRKKKKLQFSGSNSERFRSLI